MPVRWRRIETRLVGDYRVFRLLEHHVLGAHDGKVRRAYTIDACDWVNVVALTPDCQVVLVRQYRHGLDDVTVEVPGGMCDPGEEPAACAARELREETGFAGHIEPLGFVLPNPAIQTNLCHMFLARDASKVAEPEPDPNEDIEVVLEPASGIAELVQAGTIRHALVIAAFALAGIAIRPLEQR